MLWEYFILFWTAENAVIEATLSVTNLRDLSIWENKNNQLFISFCVFWNNILRIFSLQPTKLKEFTRRWTKQWKMGLPSDESNVAGRLIRVSFLGMWKHYIYIYIYTRYCIYSFIINENMKLSHDQRLNSSVLF